MVAVVDGVELGTENKLVAPFPVAEVLAFEPNTGTEAVLVIVDEASLFVLEKTGIVLVDANPTVVVAAAEPNTGVVIFGTANADVVEFKLEGALNIG